MKLKDYFASKSGTGVLSTADKNGTVDAAIYSRPHLLENGDLAFIMRERLTYSNLQQNDSAAYLFIEENKGYEGIRLFLKKTGEGTDQQQIQALSRHSISDEEDRAKGPKHLVFFRVEKILPLIGAGETAVTR